MTVAVPRPTPFRALHLTGTASSCALLDERLAARVDVPSPKADRYAVMVQAARMDSLVFQTIHGPGMGKGAAGQLGLPILVLTR